MYEKPPVKNPRSVYIDIQDIPRWMEKHQIILYDMIYTRDMKVLIIYTPLNLSDDD